MKLLLSLVVLAISVNFAVATLGVRIVFNQGNDESHKYCGESDWYKVQTALDQAAARRQLRASSSSRQLLSGYCAEICRWFRPRTCYLSGTGCRNRRTLQEMPVEGAKELVSVEEQYHGQQEAPSHRQLYLDHQCAEKKNRLVNGLNSIQNNVAQSCRNLITSQHDLSCYDV